MARRMQLCHQPWPQMQFMTPRTTLERLIHQPKYSRLVMLVLTKRQRLSMIQMDQFQLVQHSRRQVAQRVAQSALQPTIQVW